MVLIASNCTSWCGAFEVLSLCETVLELKGTKGIRYLVDHTSSLNAKDRGRDKVNKSVINTANWDIFNFNETTSWEELAAPAAGRRFRRPLSGTTNMESLLHCKELILKNWKQIFPEKELRGHMPNFHIYVSVSDLHINSHDWSASAYSAAGNIWTDPGNTRKMGPLYMLQLISLYRRKNYLYRVLQTQILFQRSCFSTSY